VWDGVVDGCIRERFTINEAFPLGLVVGEQELSNVFETLIMSIHVQDLKDKVGKYARIWGHVLMWEPLWGIGSRMGRGISW
jgi:hypothetical protein